MTRCAQLSPPKTVVVVDDDENTCLYVSDVLQASEHFNLAASFSNAQDASLGIAELNPDLTLMDICLPGLNGVECVKRLKKTMPGLKIIMFTGTTGKDWVEQSLKAGADHYLLKPVTANQLLATLEFVIFRAGKPGTGEAAPIGVKKHISEEQLGARLSLSGRESEVLKSLAQGLLYKEISETLGISYSAVHKYQQNLFKKLCVSNRSEAIRIWLENGGS